MYNSQMAVDVEVFVCAVLLFSYARLYVCVCQATAKQDMPSLDATLTYSGRISCFDNGLVRLNSNEFYSGSTV